MHCPSCNNENPEGKKFCGDCGSPLVHRCANCGAENPPRFKFCGECGKPLTEGETGKTEGETAKGVKGEKGENVELRTPNSERTAAERRQLTVMFCDLVGSTALSQQLDPEELREVVRTYQQTSATIIERFGGHLAQYLGDGLLVYFSYPVAHEDDAVRAVRAGLEIVEAIGGRGSGIRSQENHQHVNTRLSRPLQVRIGIHTGLVVIGEIGNSEKREMLALGETPNIAARIQGQANPDEVMVSAATYRLVEGLFTCEDRGQPELKGVSTPLTLYRVGKESEAQSRFQVVVRKGLTPLIGRDHEYGLLHDRWTRVKEGDGQVVLLSGEPGIGKSRLVEALKASVALEGSPCLELRCSPYAQNSALSPVIEHVQRVLGFQSEDSSEQKLQKLTQAVGRRMGTLGPTERLGERVIASAAKQSLPVTEIASSPTASRNDSVRPLGRQVQDPHRALQEVVPLFASLFSLPHPEGYPLITFSPQKQKEKTHETLVAWLSAEAREHPVIYAWEDLHWADPSTLELLTLFLAQVPTKRILVVLTFRPEFTPPWGAHSYLSQLTLSRLGRRHVEIMVEKVTGGKTLPQEVIQQIVSKTDGVPLFIEELTKSVVESVGAQHAASMPLAIPATLQDSLMARLDRLGPIKEIAQLGAAIGREFNYDLLQAVSSLNEEALQRGLQQLVESELVYQSGVPPQARYLFKHALIQDTAYQSLLKSKRQQYHRQIATMLEVQFPQTVETQPELVAHHYTEADLVEQAIPYWQQAGKKSVQRTANVEAISHLTKGLELLASLPETPERTRRELDLQLTLGPTLTTTKGWAASEVEKTYIRARELCQQVGESPQLFPVLWGLWVFYDVRGEFQKSHELGEQLLSLARSVQDPTLLLEAHVALGYTLHFLGEFIPAREHWEQGVALYDPQQHRALAVLYGGADPGVYCLSGVALALWNLGYPAQAQKRSQEALSLAQELSHPHSLAFALSFAARVHQVRREGQAAQKLAQEVIAVSTEQELAFWLAWGTIVRGGALVEQGQGEEGIAQIHQGLVAYRNTGAEGWWLYFLALLAEVYGKAEQPEEGLVVLAEALATVDKSGERVVEAELYRLKGELTLQQFKVPSSKFQVENPQSAIHNPQSEAEACFLKAIEIAQRQQAKSLELRATVSLARLWQQQGKHEEAHKLLSEVYNWFTEGFDTKDLQEAKALIEELSY